jgi:hypothetical protein
MLQIHTIRIYLNPLFSELNSKLHKLRHILFQVIYLTIKRLFPMGVGFTTEVTDPVCGEHDSFGLVKFGQVPGDVEYLVVFS